MRIKDKIALVTGAASGMGAAVARRFVAEGATVYAADINDAKGKQLSIEVGPALKFVRLDVSEEAQWLGVRKQIESEHGRLDILVNNAGYVRADDNIEGGGLALWNKTMGVNSTGTFLGCHTMFDLLKKSAAASIINIASSAVFKPDSLLAYTTSKAAVWGFTRSLAMYCGRHSLPIRCNTVHPGGTETDLLHSFLNAAPDPAAARLAGVQRHLLKRFADPAEIANVVLFLASDESSFVTGASYEVDGGIDWGTA